MKVRKSIILIILTIFLFSIASVTAANTTDVMTSTDDSTQKNEIISKEDKEIIKDGTTGTFTELQNKIRYGGSEITLDKNYTCEEGFDTAGIYIGKSITIDGQGHTIDAQGKAKIFLVNANNVVLKNIIFKNGKTDDYGGAIFWNDAAGSVSGCTFAGNSASKGGAIFWNGDVGSVSGCTFAGNSASSSGGAIYWNDAAGSVSNCTFINNSADEGGAIYWNGDVGSVSGCTFAGNSASSSGGAIFWNGDVGSVSGCTFAGNSASKGGAIFWPGAAGSADTCIFKTSSDTTYDTRILSPTLNVDNFTSFYGSGDKITFNLTTNSGIPVTDGNIFISVYFKNGVWVRDYACFSGEGWIPNLPVGLYYAIFNTEYANFQKINRTLKISDGTTFWDLNQTINADTQSEINLINNYTFNPDYDADFVEGIEINRSVTINGNGFTINAKGKASIFWVYGYNVVLKNIIFKNGNSADQGGAIYWNADAGSVSNCTFIGNSADEGGAIYHYGRYWTVFGCIFMGNSADLGGGAILSNGEDNTVFGSTFINNTAKNVGDAICTIKYLLGDYCWFGNTAENYDAALPIYGDFNCVHRLFLNATVSPDTLSVFNTSNIIFKLYLYNTTSGNTSEYDNSLFKNLNLNITAVNGNTNTTNIYLEDTVQYMATKGGRGSVTASLSTTNFTVYLNNLKIDSNMLVESQEIEYGEEYIIKLKYNVNATGKVNITLKGKKSNLTFSDLDLNNTIALGIIPVDEYNVTVIYSGDDSFFNGTANGTLIVNMAKTQITADAIITTYNIDKDLVITLKDSNGNPVTNATVNVDLNGAKTYTTDKNGQVKVSTAGLVPKIYTAKITFAGDNNYNESSIDVGVTVNKATPKIKAKKKTYKAKTKTKKFKITLKDNTGKPIKNAKVRLMVKKITKSNKKGGSDKESKADKKKNFAVTNNKGKATFKVLRNKKGKYNAKVKFYSNEYYNKVTKTVKIVIK